MSTDCWQKILIGDRGIKEEKGGGREREGEKERERGEIDS